MDMVYAVCAAVGGTIFLCQFVLTLLGMADGGHDVGDAAGHGFDVDHGGGFDADHAAGGHDFDHGGDGAGDAHGDHTTDGDHHTQHGHAANALFRVLTFRTVVAAITFFGLAGLAGSSSTLSANVTLVVAVASGLAALYVVHKLMGLFTSLGASGTVYVEQAIGATGTVYLPVPAAKTGVGKVTVAVQSRTMEYQAVTEHDALPTGAKVVVVDTIGRDTVEVQLAPDAGSTDHA